MDTETTMLHGDPTDQVLLPTCSQQPLSVLPSPISIHLSATDYGTCYPILNTAYTHWNPRVFGHTVSHSIVVTHTNIITSDYLISPGLSPRPFWVLQTTLLPGTSTLEPESLRSPPKPPLLVVQSVSQSGLLHPHHQMATTSPTDSMSMTSHVLVTTVVFETLWTSLGCFPLDTLYFSTVV